MTVDRSLAIGVFDSGLGGLTVVRSLRRSLPAEDIVYLGDTARVPYGTKSPQTVVRYSRQIARFLLDRGIKYLVVACNTASAHALPTLRQETPVPVMGVVEPGARVAAAASSSGQVGVIGTRGTVASGAYHRALHAIDPALAVFGRPCPLLVPLADEGWLEHPVTAQVARHYLTELRVESGDLDTIVLGCTHYPLLKGVLAQQAEEVFGHPVTLVDSADAVSEEVAADLARRNLARASDHAGAMQFHFSDVGHFAAVAARFMGEAIPEPQLADL